MRTIIFEGIATSGKTSVEKYLTEILTKKNVPHLFVDEEKTLMPALHNTDAQKALELLKENIESTFNQKKEVYIFDRLHITHAFRTKAEVEKFAEIETELLKHDPILIFFKIDEKKIPERISWAIKNRGSDWRHHAQTHGNDEQVNEYYTKQQGELEAIIDKSMLPHRTIDTSRMNFEEISREIYQSYCL